MKKDNFWICGKCGERFSTDEGDYIPAPIGEYHACPKCVAEYRQSLIGAPCEYCGDKVLVLRKISCENCPYGIIEDSGECGKLPDCPQGKDEWYYKTVMDDNNNYCPHCGRKLIEDTNA